MNIIRFKYLMYINIRKLKWFLKGLYNLNARKTYHELVDTAPKYIRNNSGDNTIYIARKKSQVEGHGSILSTMLGHFALAEKLGMVPVVDMKNYFSELWQHPQFKGKENAWEYFYTQPGSYSLKDGYSGSSVFLSDSLNPPFYPSYRRTFESEDEIKYWNRIYRDYIHYNDKTYNRIITEYNQFNIEDGNTLAVSIRRGIEWGHMIGNAGFKNHCHVQPIDEIINLAKDKFQEWNCKYLFLVIDDVEGVELFREAFGEYLRVLNRPRWKYFINGKPNIDAEVLLEKSEDIYEKEVLYLTELFITSKCTSFIGIKSSSSMIPLIMRGSFYDNMILIGE